MEKETLSDVILDGIENTARNSDVYDVFDYVQQSLVLTNGARDALNREWCAMPHEARYEAIRQLAKCKGWTV